MTDKSKKAVRDIQNRTGWRYQGVKFLVDTLGYEAVSRAVDDAQEESEKLPAANRIKAMNDLLHDLGKKVRATQATRKASWPEGESEAKREVRAR